MKSEMKFIKRLMVMVVIGLLFVAYGHWLTKTVRGHHQICRPR